MEFPLLFALLMVVVAAAMIWGARKRHRHAQPAARESTVDGRHGSIDRIDASRAGRPCARLNGPASGIGNGKDGPDGGGGGGD